MHSCTPSKEQYLVKSGAGTKGMDRNGQLEERREGNNLQPPIIRLSEAGVKLQPQSTMFGEPSGLSRLTAKSLTQMCLCVELLPCPRSH